MSIRIRIPSLLLMGFCQTGHVLSHISVCLQLTPNLNNVKAYRATQATSNLCSYFVSNYTWRRISSEVVTGSSCLLTLMFVREKGMGIAVCSISCGSQAGLGSLFPFTDSTSHWERRPSQTTSLAWQLAACPSNVLSGLMKGLWGGGRNGFGRDKKGKGTGVQ